MQARASCATQSSTALGIQIPQVLARADEVIQPERAMHDRFGSNSAIAVMSAARPLFHRKRKSIRNLAMSQKCH